MRYTAVLLLLALLLAACASTPSSLDERVVDSDSEIMYDQVLGTPSTGISFFGISIGDSESDLLSLHGPADKNRSYRFGRTVNYEYGFGLNHTAVLYHTERGVVTSVLVTREASPLLSNSTLELSLEDVYSSLGIPDLQVDRSSERVFYYDSLGYEVFIKKRNVDRIFFTTPNRGISGPGTPTNSSYNLSDFENEAPQICIQVVTPAVSPEGSCEEFPTPCDVPDGWDVVESCP